MRGYAGIGGGGRAGRRGGFVALPGRRRIWGGRVGVGGGCGSVNPQKGKAKAWQELQLQQNARTRLNKHELWGVYPVCME